jgi:ABC-type amino acid transport system permease subunit
MTNLENTLVEESNKWKKLKKWKYIIFIVIVIVIVALTTTFVVKSNAKKKCIQDCNSEHGDCLLVMKSTFDICMSQCLINYGECSGRCNDIMTQIYNSCGANHLKCLSSC